MATYTDNYQLTKPTYAEQADIGVINSNMNIIDDIMHSSQVSLAPAYDSTQTYAEGDVVMYELLMYKCISPTTGVWDGSKWERTTASESGGGGSAELDILGEASGAVASFADGASAGLAKCIAEIVPTQAGSGTPSPDNVRAISGSTSVTVTISDGETSTTKTIPLGQTVYGGQLNVLTGELTIDRYMVVLDGVNSTVSVSAATNPNGRAVIYSAQVNTVDVYRAKSLCDKLSWKDGTHAELSLSEYTATVASGGASMTVRFVLPISSSATTADANTYLQSNNYTFVFPLATPQTVQLTPQEVNSLLGQNNISADTGDIDIVYVKASAPIQPNPTGTPTATLSKLGIEGTVFEVPSGGGGSSLINYSTTEQKTGQKWINGKDIYIITVITSDINTTNRFITQWGINDIDDIVFINATYHRSDKGVKVLDGYNGTVQDYGGIIFDITQTAFTVQIGRQILGGNVWCTIQYTKITD